MYYTYTVLQLYHTFPSNLYLLLIRHRLQGMLQNICIKCHSLPFVHPVAGSHTVSSKLCNADVSFNLSYGIYIQACHPALLGSQIVTSSSVCLTALRSTL